MELALLVWLVDLLGTLGTVGIALSCVILGIQSLIGGFQLIDGCFDDFTSWNKKYFPLKTFIFVCIISVLIPNEKTMKYMGAAYLIQTTFESDFVQESATLSQKAILNQLGGWSADSEEVKELIKGVGLPLVEDAAKDLLGVEKECKVGSVVVVCAELNKVSE